MSITKYSPTLPTTERLSELKDYATSNLGLHYILSLFFLFSFCISISLWDTFFVHKGEVGMPPKVDELKSSPSWRLYEMKGKELKKFCYRIFIDKVRRIWYACVVLIGLRLSSELTREHMVQILVLYIECHHIIKLVKQDYRVPF